MSRFVIDTSVAIKWYVPEIDSDHAAKLLEANNEFHAPDLLFSEFGNTLWKKVRREELSSAEARSIVQALSTIPLQILPSHLLLEAALETAIQTSCTVYDSLYLALAVALDCVLVTADDRFLNAMQKTPLSKHLVHVRNI